MILWTAEATVCEQPRNLPNNVACLGTHDSDAIFQVRARTSADAARLIADLDAVVLEQTISICRANRPGEPIFYGYDFRTDEVIEIGEDY